MPFPLCPPPLTDTGAYTNPRELQRWLDVNPVSKLDRPRKFITLPAFDQGDSTWNGYSDIVAAFNCEAPNNFSLQGLVKDIPANTNYTLTISYRIGGTVTRYMLWDAAGSNLNQTITPYSGQGILKNFRFEVWNTLQGAASQATSIDIFTSVLNKFDWRYATDSILKASDTEVTNFNYNASLPYQSPGFRLLNAGTAAVNGIYTQTNEPFGVLYNGRLVYSNGLYIIRYESNRWNIFALNTTLYYHANNNYYNPIAPNLSIWIADAGSNPAPTAQLLGQPVYMGVFNLPLTFPTNSVSTTN